MNDIEINKSDETNMNSDSCQTCCQNISETLHEKCVQKPEKLQFSFGDFFERCRQIYASEQAVSTILDELNRFKINISNLLGRPINSLDEFQVGIGEIKPLLDFWMKYGEKFRSIINNADDAQEILTRYDKCPDLEQSVLQLRKDIEDKDSSLRSLEESELKKNNDDLQKKINDLNGELAKLQEDLNVAKNDKDSIIGEKQQLSSEYEALKEKYAQEQISFQDESERIKNAYSIKQDEVEALKREITVLHIIPGLVADAFKIDTQKGPEFEKALSSTQKILRSCVEYGRNKPIGENIIENIEGIIKENAKISELEKKLKYYKDTNERQQAQLSEHERKLEDANSTTTSLTKQIESYKKTIDNLKESIVNLRTLNNATQASLVIRNDIIQGFNEVSSDIESIVNAIENEGGSIEKLKDILQWICKQNNRMTEIDELANAYNIEALDVSSIQDIFTKYNAYDFTKQYYDIYLGFIMRVMKIRGIQWTGTEGQPQQEHILGAFEQEYERLLKLCGDFEEIPDSAPEQINMDKLESNRAEMYLAIDSFYQYAGRATNALAIGNRNNLYQKIASLPALQAKLSQSIESAVFSINYSRTKVEEVDNLQKKLNELQLKYEKQENVLNLMEKKLYPNFMTAQNLGRRDKLINDIEFGLTNDSVQALLLKSYLGLLGFAEREHDTISDETMIWILQQLPKALYIFYQNNILDGATDISSDNEVYDVMSQLMNKINKFILKGNFFLSMPRLGSAITLDSMEVLENTNTVNAVVSWMISNSRHKIIQKALVK